MGALILFTLFIVAPCAIAAWAGTRVGSPLLAFVLTWIITPLVSVLITAPGVPILRAITPPGNDGTWVIVLPFSGIATGLIAGIAAAVIVSRRRARKAESPFKADESLDTWV